MSSVKKHEFKTEIRQILNLIINSLYSNKEIFLRELISNASDAIDKLKFKSQTDADIIEADTEFKIKIKADSFNNTLEITDNGIGMTYEEVMQNIGTIAKSGTIEFLNSMKEANNKEAISAEMIGQFGVGFYSAFIVAEKITLITKAAKNQKGVKWESSGDGSYTIEEVEKEKRGTSITLHLKKIDKDEENFTDEFTIKRIVKKHSDFIRYPILMDVEKDEPVKNPVLDKDGKPIEGQTEKVIKEETLNSMKAIWAKSKQDITEEEYTEFYKHIARDWNAPLAKLHFKLEGATEYDALLYIPSKAAADLFQPDKKHGVHLYSRRVFVMDDCEELMPSYFRFIKGVVDAADLNLNVSREILQQDFLIKNIKRNLVKKIFDLLSSLEEEKFIAFYKEFGNALKEGVHTDWENKDKIADLIRYKTTKSKDKLISLKEYTANMKPDQKDIYYITGDNLSMLINSPHIEKLKDKNYEVLLMTDPIDEWVVQALTKYDGKPLKSAEKGDIDIDNKEDEKEIEDKTDQPKDYDELFQYIKSELSDKIKNVKASVKLKDSISCLSGDAYDMSAYMEKIMQASGQKIPTSKRVLEINVNHSAFKKINNTYQNNKKSEDIKRIIKALYDLALISEGGKIDNPSEFNKTVSKLMNYALQSVETE
ncbi:MAG: molecular chaperone HtpG [Deltaproteobacteria bacterium]|nr:molecular chaperone HtpG [Deltaproteobacteria bacterium]